MKISALAINGTITGYFFFLMFYCFPMRRDTYREFTRTIGFSLTTWYLSLMVICRNYKRFC